MNQRDSTLVRIGRDTKFKLEQLAAKWAQLYAEGRMDVPAPNDKDVISIDRVIAELLRRDDEHRRRSKRSIASPPTPGAIRDEDGKWIDRGTGSGS